MIYYIYNGSELLGFVYNNNTYYYHKNIFGDIIGILDSNYNEVVSYEYDSWGALVNITDNSNINLGTINPFRYRSYYYDNETSLYYLNSRYYKPEFGRFINADSMVLANQDIISGNIFQYVSNNPVNNSDTTGRGFVDALPRFDWKKAKDVIEDGLRALGAAGSAIGSMVGAIAPYVFIIGGTALLVETTYNYARNNYSSNDTSNNNNNNSHTVYALVDNNNMAQYVGRTNNPEVRAIAHLQNSYRNSLTMRIIKDDLNFFEARGVEQNLIEYCNVLNKGDYMHNQINGIRLGTENYSTFTAMGTFRFDNNIIPIVGDRCYIDPNLYPAVR